MYPNGRHDVQYLCQCECGRELKVLGIHLRSGHTKSCGCFRKETTAEMASTHHMTNTRLYNVWRNMKARCYKPTHKDYSLYGGRGIQICDEWLSSFEAFVDWALHNGYSDNLTIDRIDVNGNYEPSNCAWRTQKQQCNNTRRNIVIEFRGETHTMKEWSEILGMNYGTISSRIANGWPYEKALSTPIRAHTH